MGVVIDRYLFSSIKLLFEIEAGYQFFDILLDMANQEFRATAAAVAEDTNVLSGHIAEGHMIDHLVERVDQSLSVKPQRHFAC
jgi:hypothetical protein